MHAIVTGIPSSLNLINEKHAYLRLPLIKSLNPNITIEFYSHEHKSRVALVISLINQPQFITS